MQAPSGRRLDERAARQWLFLALASLVAAGVFAIAVVIGRTPPFDRFVTDPGFFKRCLVAHVNLALVTWFYAFLGALLLLTPSARSAGPIARHAVHLAAAGVGLIVAGAAIPDGQPLLANYIPTIAGPVFQLGQLLFACGVLASLASPRLWSRSVPSSGGVELPGAARAGLRSTAVAIGLAGTTLIITAITSPSHQPFDVRYEFLVWGAGHVLQLVSVAGMLTVWILLLTPVLGASPITPRAARVLFLALVLPWTAAPLFALAGTDSFAYRRGFTGLMRWCLFPIVGVFLTLSVNRLRRAWRAGRIDGASLRDPRLSAFVVSAALTLLGFGLGAAIRGSNTIVPAHYHAAVGGVTVAFMAATFVLLPILGIAAPAGRFARAATWQSSIYGLGMLIFTIGFALAGAYGMGRKIYGAEQAGRGAGQSAGLALMGAGGLVAIVGGVLFLAIVVWWWRAGHVTRVVDRGLKTPVPPKLSPEFRQL